MHIYIYIYICRERERDYVYVDLWRARLPLRAAGEGVAEEGAGLAPCIFVVDSICYSIIVVYYDISPLETILCCTIKQYNRVAEEGAGLAPCIYVRIRNII